jgi:hypothetical protein
MSFFKRGPLIDEDEQLAREKRTETARQKAIKTRQHAEANAAHVDASTARLTRMRLSFEKADRRLSHK